MTTSTESDSRTEEGLTLGLMDALLTISRVLAPRLRCRSSQAISEALRDFYSDESMREIQLSVNGIIRGDK